MGGSDGKPHRTILNRPFARPLGERNPNPQRNEDVTFRYILSRGALQCVDRGASAQRTMYDVRCTMSMDSVRRSSSSVLVECKVYDARRASFVGTPVVRIGIRIRTGGCWRVRVGEGVCVNADYGISHGEERRAACEDLVRRLSATTWNEEIQPPHPGLRSSISVYKIFKFRIGANI